MPPRNGRDRREDLQLLRRPVLLRSSAWPTPMGLLPKPRSTALHSVSILGVSAS